VRVAAGARPSDAQIRRALAECMTGEDIDDAMGWPRGTARRRRWMAPDRGGLPFADAELGGVALWFRSTFEAWQDIPTTRAGRRRAVTAVVDEQDVASPAAERTRSRSRPSDVRTARNDDRELPTAQKSANGVEDGVAEDAAGHVSDQDDKPGEAASAVLDTDDDGVGGALALRSGYDLSSGQRVLAEIGGRWREARVSSRDHSSVLVEYQLDDSPLGARVRRLGIDRIRVSTTGGDEE
jgi:hypothetical protein